MARSLKESQEALRKVKIAYEDAKNDKLMASALPKFEEKIKALELEIKNFESGEKKPKKKTSSKESEPEKPKRRVARKRATSTKKDSVEDIGKQLKKDMPKRHAQIDKALGSKKEGKVVALNPDYEIPEKEINEKDCQDEINAYIKRQEARTKAKETREANKQKASAKKTASKGVAQDLSDRSILYIKSVIKHQKKSGKVNTKEVEHFAKLLREALVYAKEKFSTFKSMKPINSFDKEVKKLVEELEKSENK